jgi:hypothetical protein
MRDDLAMTDKPVSVDGVRRLLNVSPEAMSDYDLRRALAVLACDYDPDGGPDEVAESARRFADALDRLRPL